MFPTDGATAPDVHGAPWTRQPCTTLSTRPTWRYVATRPSQLRHRLSFNLRLVEQLTQPKSLSGTWGGREWGYARKTSRVAPRVASRHARTPRQRAPSSFGSQVAEAGMSVPTLFTASLFELAV